MDEAGKSIKKAVELIQSIDPTKLDSVERWRAADTVQNYAIYLHHTTGAAWQKYQSLADQIRYPKI